MNVIFYHKNCYDGHAAAWVASHALPNNISLPVAYGDPVPSVLADSEIYILDFSFPKDVLIEMSTKVQKLVVLDHHKTAQANLEGLDFCQFDMNRSGAGMTWDYFHPNQPRPDLINFVEDRDLWRFKLPKTKEIHAYISSFPMDFRTWDQLNTDIIYHYADCVYAGENILRYHAQKVIEMAEAASIQEVGGYRVPVVNCPYQFASDILHLLTNRYPDAAFAAGWSEQANGVRRYSLRGRSTDDFDVSMVAKQFGGGGHKKAAGFEVPLRKARE